MVQETISREQWRTIIDVARQAILQKELISYQTELHRIYFGVFVTLYKEKKLRGCMGELSEDGLSPEALSRAAMAAAYGDPRFPPVEPKEWALMELEVSFLYGLCRAERLLDFVPGEHGMLVKYGKRQGVFLPKVAAERGWDGKRTLDMLCLNKLMMEPQAIDRSKLEVFFFKGISWRENL